MSNVFLLFPLVILFICGFLIPAILDRIASATPFGTLYTLLISFLMLVSMGGFVMGAMLGFSLIENKDENTLINIAVSPVTVSGYTTFKIVYASILAFFGNIVTLGGLKWLASDKYVVDLGSGAIRILDVLSIPEILAFSLSSALVVPMVAMIIGATAKNKVEGFAIMKSSGFLVMIPLLALLNIFKDGKQYILGIIPNFWPMKALLNEIFGALSMTNSADLPYYWYLMIGGVYMIFVGVLCLRFFMKKANLK